MITTNENIVSKTDGENNKCDADCKALPADITVQKRNVAWKKV